MRRRGARNERGATAVEFAFVAMPLCVLLFGMIELGWAFFSISDVRHASREGIRLAALDTDPSPAHGSPSTQGERIAQETCERMDRRTGATVSISIDDTDANGLFDVGDEITLQLSKPFDQVTSFFSAIFDTTVIDETVVSRLEQTPEGTIDGTNWTCA